MSTPTQPLSSPGTDTDTDTVTGVLVEERPDTRLDDGDHERFAHYVQKEKIVESAVMGTPVIALCGKVWVPGRDPQKFPVCPDCKRIYEGLPAGGGKGGKGGDGKGGDGGES